MASNDNINYIPNGGIILNKKIYIPISKNEIYIPDNSILYKDQVYIEYKQITNKLELNDNNKSKSVDLIKENDKFNDNITNSQIRKSNSISNNKESESQLEKEEDSKLTKDNWTKEEMIFKNLNKYYYNVEDKRIMKYSLNRMNKNRKKNKINSISFNCYDSYCLARAHATVKYKKIGDIETVQIDNFTIKNKHTIEIDEHIFIINQDIENDIKNNSININKLKNICYARAYFINIIKNNRYTQLNKIEQDFVKKYSITEINSRGDSNVKIPVKKVIQ